MDIVEALKKFNGKTIKTANLYLLDGVGEQLELIFTDGSKVTIYGNMLDVNQIEIEWNEKSTL